LSCRALFLDVAPPFRGNINRSSWKIFGRRRMAASPVIVGNTVGYDVLGDHGNWRTRARGLLIGRRPRARPCHVSRRPWIGSGVPKWPRTRRVAPPVRADASSRKTSRYVPIITDGGRERGGDVCKALACGADAGHWFGARLAKAYELRRRLPLGHATPAPRILPRGTRTKCGATGSLKTKFCSAPAEGDDGNQNWSGAITDLHGQNVGAKQHRRISADRDHPIGAS